MNDYLKIKKRDSLIRIGIKDEFDNPKLDKDGREVFIEFDLEDINTIDKYNKATKMCENAGRTLRDEISIIEKKQDIVKNGISKNVELKYKTMQKYFSDIEKSMDLFLGEGGFSKIFGEKRYLTMLDDLSDMLEPIIPLLKINAEDLKKKIVTKYKNIEENILLDE